MINTKRTFGKRKEKKKKKIETRFCIGCYVVMDTKLRLCLRSSFSISIVLVGAMSGLVSCVAY